MSSEMMFPKLQFTVDGMRASIVAAVLEKNEDLVRMINGAMEKAVDQIQAQLEAQVQAALGVVMNEAIQRAAEMTAAGLADELADAMAIQVRSVVAKKLKPKARR